MVAHSQSLCGGRPASFMKKMPVMHEVCQMPSRQQLSSMNLVESASAAGMFAVPMSTDFNPCNSGQWDDVDGKRIWRLVISSPNAYSLNITFSDFLLPQRAELYIYNSDTTHVIGAYSSDNNADILPTIPLAGDVVTVEYVEPYDVDFPGFFNIVQVAHDFKGAFAAQADVSPAQCHVDIDSETGNNWQAEKRSVCRILIGGTSLCTGTLLNTANRSFDPYVLTARHCINSERLAQNSIFYFNYEGDQTEPQYVIGSSLIAVKNNDNGFLDFALVRLSESVPMSFNAYYAGWDISENKPVGAVCIHHPNGGLKKMAIDYDTLNIDSYRNFDAETMWNVKEWDEGATEQGSSGAPLFNSEHRVIGVLAGGDSDCSYPMNDYFQMLSVCYDRYEHDSLQLAHWLNPQGMQISQLAGAYCKPNSLATAESNAMLSVSPNPASDQLLVSAGKPIVYISLTSVLGVQVLNLKCGFGRSATIDIAKLPQGMYVCHAVFADGTTGKSAVIKTR